MEILARHLTVDMYNCKVTKIANTALLKEALHDAIQASNLHVINADCQILEGEQTASFLLLKEGHVSVHSFPELNYIAVDVFVCMENTQPEKILVKALRKFFKPEKTKMTSLKRGDFGTVKDMKPKIKTKIAPMRRIRSTGAKVIRLLARRKIKQQ